MSAFRSHNLSSRLIVFFFSVFAALLISACGQTAVSPDGDADWIDSPEQEELESDGDVDRETEAELDSDRDGDSDSHENWENPNGCDPNPCLDLHRSQCRIGPQNMILCDCDPGYIVKGGVCRPDPANSGESCDWPVPLEPGVAYLGDTTGSGSQLEPSCVGTWKTGPERVYALSVEERRFAWFYLKSPDAMLNVRRECSDDASDVLCLDEFDDGVLRDGGILEPGEYSVVVDSYFDGAAYELRMELRRDPCEGDPCPGEPDCVSSEDWGRADCVCDEGKIAQGTRCIADPCEPNPCRSPHKTICTVDAEGEALCGCDDAFIPDGLGACIPDPLGNEWLVMVYLNADNNLERVGYEDLEEMVAAGNNYRVKVVVLFDSYSRDNGATRRLILGPEGVRVAEILPEADMADGQTLADFGRWALSHYPARKAALVLWDHGTGWTKRASEGSGDSGGYKGFNTDEHGAGGELSISSGEYGQALAAIRDLRGRPLDLVGFDACYMGMWEVALATAPYANYLVASMDQEPDSGWAYNNVLGALVADPDMDARSLGAHMVTSFSEDSDENDTLASVDLNALTSVNVALDKLAAAMLADPDVYPIVEELREQAQKVFLFETYRDLRHVAQLLATSPDLSAEIRQAANELDLATAAALSAVFVHPRYENGHGLTIYFPGHDGWVHPSYVVEQAPWVDQSLWDDFLLDFAGLPDIP